jgi:hypothetical protein
MHITAYLTYILHTSSPFIIEFAFRVIILSDKEGRFVNTNMSLGAVRVLHNKSYLHSHVFYYQLQLFQYRYFTITGTLASTIPDKKHEDSLRLWQ